MAHEDDFERVAQDIRILTQAISLIQPRNAPCVKPVPSKAKKFPAVLKAYTRLAILLTQGSSTDISGRHVITVVGRLAPESVQVMINEEECNGSREQVVCKSRNASTSSRAHYKTLKDLSDICINKPDEQVSVKDHAADLFEALRELSRNPEDLTPQFHGFVWLRCHRKIRHRIQLASFLLGKNLDVALNDWHFDVTQHDTLEEGWCPVHQVYWERLAAVPSRESRSKRNREFLFRVQDVNLWKDVVSHALASVYDAITGWEKEKTNAAVSNILIKFNRFIVFTDKGAVIERLPGLRSLDFHLQKLMEDHRRGRQQNLSFRGSSEAEEVAEMEGGENDVIFDLEAERILEGIDDVSTPKNILLLYCRSIVSWMTAGVALARSKLIQDPHFKFDVRIVHATQPSISFNPAEIRNLIYGDVKTQLCERLGDEKAANADALLAETLKKCGKTSFRGTVHCEAMFMALISAANSPEEQELNSMGGELARFKNLDRVIGVGKKSCFCCYWLSRKLHASETGENFIVPGTHGIAFAWNPPAFGIPLSVLEDLRLELIDRLVTMIVESHNDEYSRQSSPVSDVRSFTDFGPGYEDQVNSKYFS